MGYPKTIYVQHVTAPFFGRAFEDRPAGYAVRYDMHDDEAQAEISRLQAELAAEKALADRLAEQLQRWWDCFHTFPWRDGDDRSALDAYRKARGL